MSDQEQPSREQVDHLSERLEREAQAGGYHLNPDVLVTKDLIRGILVNEKRYGYWACPCRLASGDHQEDLDIICPCDYRDVDLTEYGACYCALYVSETVARGEASAGSIPERRPEPDKRRRPRSITETLAALPVPVWRCRVCGYLCARDGPPETCPVCRAQKDRFERFI